MRRTDLPPPDLTPYTTAQVRFAASAWPMRAIEEQRSALVYRALLRAAQRVNGTEAWLGRIESAMRDELRHAHLCALVGAKLGAAAPRYDGRAVRARVAALPEAAMRAASLLLVEVAIGETVSMYLFRAGRRLATEPLTRAALGAIVGDEVGHQKLGWRGLGALLPVFGPEIQAAMQREAARGLAGCERQTAVPAMQWLERRLPFDPAYSALGVLDPAIRVEAFYQAIERLVVPRLTRLGLDGALAWSKRYAPA